MKLIPNLTPIDNKAIHELGIPSLLLMEEAGRQVALKVNRLITEKKLNRPLVTLICGKGRNGGDGFVCARRLAMMGTCDLIVIPTASPSELTGDSLINFNLLRHHNVTVYSDLMDDRFQEALNRSDIVVDALFGSGLSRPIEGRNREIINAMNDCGAFIVAVDLPSGVNSATGEIMGVAVKSDFTVTFAASKPGLYVFPGRGYAGQVDVVDIGIPPVLIEEDPSTIFLLNARMVKNRLPVRKGLSHKYSYGSVLVVAGSRDMPGAAAMTAEAALKSGAGLVVLACPASSFARMQLSSEIICFSLPETDEGVIEPNATDFLINAWGHRVNTVAFGPGMTACPSAIAFVERFLPFLHHQFQGNVIIDADGLNCLSAITPAPQLGSRFILTPHLGECSRLTGMDKQTVQNDLLTACTKTAQKYNATIVLKSASTVIYGSNERLWINPTGNPGMATAGSGDVLTGMVAGFAAQGLTPDRAARVAVYLHGLSGDIGSEKLTQYCLSATDLIHYLPEAIKQVQG